MKMIYKTSVLLLLSCFTLKSYSQTVTFTIQAHQDDWQLFMASTINGDVSSGKKMVSITLTAGDGGNGTLSGFECPIPYFLAREIGSVYSSQFIADMDFTMPLAKPVATTVNILGHNIIKYTYKNTVNYFLRLPDGAPLGTGETTTGLQSLRRLKIGAIPSIAAIDGIATYNGWNDLKSTIQNIITLEQGSASQAWLNTASLDTLGRNAGDHSDHIYTSILAQEAINDKPWIGINEFIDYQSAVYTQNLTTVQHATATALFAAYSWSLLESKYGANYDNVHKAWLPMDILIVKRQPVGTANGTPVTSAITAPLAEPKPIPEVFNPYSKTN
jgi:hypothetical protein